MACLYPQTLNIDGHYIQVSCGRCQPCRIARRLSWTVRLRQELMYWDNSRFITLTYNDDNLPSDYGLHPEDLQKFFKRLRKSLNEDQKIKYYACGEYGDISGRPHYHAIVYGVDDIDLIGNGRDKRMYQKNGSYNIESSLWPFGFLNVGLVTDESIQYVAGYVNKKLGGKDAEEKYGERYPPFARMSQGLGKSWFQEHPTLSDTTRYKGRDVPLPRYYKKLRGDGKLSDFELDLLHFKQMINEDGQLLTMAQSKQRQLKYDWQDENQQRGSI